MTILSQKGGKNLSHPRGVRLEKWFGINAPFTPDEDCRATGRDSPNRHLLLVVATVRHTLLASQK